MIWTLLGVLGVAGIWFLLPKSKNEKQLDEQRQMLADAEKLYSDLVEQIDRLPQLKARHQHNWPAKLNIAGTRQLVVERGSELSHFQSLLSSAHFPIDADQTLELQVLALDFLNTSKEIGNLVADFVVTDVVREAGRTAQSFGKKVH